MSCFGRSLVLALRKKLKFIRPSAALGAVMSALMLFNAIAAPAPGPSAPRPGGSHALPLDYQTQIDGQVVRFTAHTLTIRTLHGDRVFAVDKTTVITPHSRPMSSFRKGELISVSVERLRDGYLHLKRIALRATQPL